MKKIVIIIFTVLAFSSCERDSIVPESELPQWLTEKIQSDESYIKEFPKSWIAAGKWIRTEWNESYYYEYINYLSSTILAPISHSRDTLDLYNQIIMDDYRSNMCCEKLVWEGPWSIK